MRYVLAGTHSRNLGTKVLLFFEIHKYSFIFLQIYAIFLKNALLPASCFLFSIFFCTFVRFLLT